MIVESTEAQIKNVSPNIAKTGSMNMGGTAKIETLEIFNCEKMYNFVAEQYEYLKQHFRIKSRYYD